MASRTGKEDDCEIKQTLHGNGFQALEWNDVMTPGHDADHDQEDHHDQKHQLISQIFHSRAN